ncbi:hypothetical protein KUCAC02_023847 [Chaenocephalus aceratus]|uniref:Uncharacterized protein n=1 Tax=Chaenocephalus aceratus TaxID=36190 RepID=A0ACB9WGZ0_CHAAC|nr:hypothetical protein KUCAC02_023847 [Chaenocephalus aceratus]
MQFSSRTKKFTTNSQTELYSHPLLFYVQPPLENISLMEFETFAVERLKLLKTIENLGVSYVKLSDQYIKKLEAESKALNFLYRPEADDRKPLSGPTEQEKRRKDHISHFILRLAYCQTEDLRRWFIQQEVDLFRYRFNDLYPKQKLEFLHRNNLQYDTISVEEKKALHDKLVNSSYAFSGITVEDQDFYKVPFQDALDLVRLRKVYLKAGYVYIPHQEIVTIVLNDFRTRLSKALALTARSLPAVHSDERLQPLLNHLSHAYVGQDYSNQKNVGKISLEQIDSLSGKSFPLCMRQIHQSLRENHHLRHGGRMQYGLFLKGIGLSLEQALQFWRSEFIKGKVDADKSGSALGGVLHEAGSLVCDWHREKMGGSDAEREACRRKGDFDKAYAYSVRHMFGKEGKRTDYTPYSCMKVILSNAPSQGDHHGCPFRHSNPELLKQKLQVYKVSPSGIIQILELIKGMHYQLACQKYFELTHNVEEASFSLNHPNQYFIESQKVLAGGRDIKRETDAPQKPQENSTKAPSAAPEAAANTQDVAEMTEELDSFFQDA